MDGGWTFEAIHRSPEDSLRSPRGRFAGCLVRECDQTLEKARQVRAAIVAREGVDLVDDDS